MLQGTEDFFSTMDDFLPCMFCFLLFSFVSIVLGIWFCWLYSVNRIDVLLFCLPGETSQLE